MFFRAYKTNALSIKKLVTYLFECDNSIIYIILSVYSVLLWE